MPPINRIFVPGCVTIVSGGRLVLENELGRLLEGTADAAFVVDAGGVLRSWNRPAEKLLGYRALEVIGRPCADLIEGRCALGTSVCRTGCDVLRLMAAGSAIPNFDLEVRTRSGDRIWMNVSILQFHDTRTRREFAVHLMRDIGDRKKAEDAGRNLLQAARELVALSGEAAAPAPVGVLTVQERKILRLLAAGRRPADITRQLHIRERTLRNHLHHVNRKLRTRNRLEAVMQAVRRGLI